MYDLVPGRLHLTFDWMGTRLEAGHTVDPDQFEPGIPDEEQAGRHLVELSLRELAVRLSLGLTERWALDVGVPLREVEIEADFEDAQGRPLPDFVSIHHRDETITGVGDLTVTGRYRWKPLNLGGWFFDLAGGVSLPTGNTEEDPFELGRRGLSHQHLFFGSGTVDPIVGVTGVRQSQLVPGVGWLRIKAPFDESSEGYQAGEQLSAGLALNPTFGWERWSFTGQVELFHEGTAQWGGHPARNSGRTDLLANVGASWTPTPDWTVQTVARFPWNLDAKGGQIELEPILSLAVTRSWSLREHTHDEEHGDDDH